MAEDVADVLEAKLAKLFVAQVRNVDNGLGDLVQGHLDAGYSLPTVKAMLDDAMRVARAAQQARSAGK